MNRVGWGFIGWFIIAFKSSLILILHSNIVDLAQKIGNKHFCQGLLLDANDYYTHAIEMAPYVEVRPTGVELLRLELEFKEVQQEAWPNAVNSKWTMQRLTTHKMTTARSHENDKQTNLEDGSLD